MRSCCMWSHTLYISPWTHPMWVLWTEDWTTYKTSPQTYGSLFFVWSSRSLQDKGHSSSQRSCVISANQYFNNLWGTTESSAGPLTVPWPVMVIWQLWREKFTEQGMKPFLGESIHPQGYTQIMHRHCSPVKQTCLQMVSHSSVRPACPPLDVLFTLHSLESRSAPQFSPPGMWVTLKNNKKRLLLQMVSVWASMCSPSYLRTPC